MGRGGWQSQRNSTAQVLEWWWDHCLRWDIELGQEGGWCICFHHVFRLRKTLECTFAGFREDRAGEINGVIICLEPVGVDHQGDLYCQALGLSPCPPKGMRRSGREGEPECGVLLPAEGVLRKDMMTWGLQVKHERWKPTLRLLGLIFQLIWSF